MAREEDLLCGEQESREKAERGHTDVRCAHDWVTTSHPGRGRDDERLGALKHAHRVVIGNVYRVTSGDQGRCIITLEQLAE